MQPYDYIRDGAAIYERSFATIRAEADLSSFSAEQAQIVVRIIHACGMVNVAQSVMMTEDFVSSARKSLKKSCAVLCDSEMVAHGITRARLPADNAVVCTAGCAHARPCAADWQHPVCRSAGLVGGKAGRGRCGNRECAYGPVPSSGTAGCRCAKTCGCNWFASRLCRGGGIQGGSCKKA